MKSFTIPVNRTARFYTLGPVTKEAEEVWFVLHGYGQLASYFIRHFEPLNNGRRLIVAPEALSRFYVSRNPERIGATWMTAEHREHEIEDYLSYLNQMAGHVLDAVERRRLPMTVLGFSQGATTASRWVTLGRLPATRLIMWAGSVGHDLDLAEHRETLSRLDVTYVVGDSDQYATPDAVALERKRLEEHDIPYAHIPFEGDHRMDSEVLLSLGSQHRSRL